MYHINSVFYTVLTALLYSTRLVGHIPRNLVLRRLEHIVQRHGQLDNSKGRAKVTARLRYRLRERFTIYTRC